MRAPVYEDRRVAPGEVIWLASAVLAEVKIPLSLVNVRSPLLLVAVSYLGYEPPPFPRS